MTDDERQLLLDTAYVAMVMMSREGGDPDMEERRNRQAYIEKLRTIGARVQATVDKAKEAE